jgi:RNA polymerase sigma-70 factor (ECF subfamily)
MTPKTDHLGIALAPAIERPSSPDLIAEVTAWFVEWRMPLLRYLASIGLAPQDSEEVAQEVFLALFDHLRRGKPRDNLRGWIFRVAHNLGLKKRYRALHLVPLDSEAHEHRMAEPDPEELATETQRRRRLRAIVRAMAPKDRACLMLRAEGLRYREIGEVLGMSLGAVANSLERGLAKLGAAEGER